VSVQAFEKFLMFAEIKGYLGGLCVAEKICHASDTLEEIGRNPETDPQEIRKACRELADGLGHDLFFELVQDTAPDVDDLWVDWWCPQPPGHPLSAAYCPAGCTPLWTNGKMTVFLRPEYDKHDNRSAGIGVCEEMSQ